MLAPTLRRGCSELQHISIIVIINCVQFLDSVLRLNQGSLFSQLTVGTGSLQVRYDSENVIHQVGPLLVLQDAACGGVGRVHVGQVGQVHP